MRLDYIHTKIRLPKFAKRMYNCPFRHSLSPFLTLNDSMAPEIKHSTWVFVRYQKHILNEAVEFLRTSSPFDILLQMQSTYMFFRHYGYLGIY